MKKSLPYFQILINISLYNLNQGIYGDVTKYHLRKKNTF